jgi:hypothetical protein
MNDLISMDESKTTISIRKADLQIFKTNYMKPEEKTFQAFGRALVELKVKPDAQQNM